MSEHHAKVEWKLQGPFEYRRYPRAHRIEFEGGVEIPGNASPQNIPATVPAAPGADPEQTLVAALCSCHMLWFLHLASDKKWVVEHYVDQAVGVLDKTWISKITLRPRVTFSGAKPSEAEHRALHHLAHEKCFIANSIKSEVVIEPSC